MGYCGLCLNRRPRPPPAEAAPSPISSMPKRVERADQLGEGIDIAADDAVARLHALDGGDGEARLVGEAALVNAEKGPRGAKLRGSYHV